MSFSADVACDVHSVRQGRVHRCTRSLKVDPIRVIVATKRRHDVAADGVAMAIDRRRDMVLVRGNILDAADVETALDELPSGARCAIVLVVHDADQGDDTQSSSWVSNYPGLVLLRVAVIGDLIQFRLRDQLHNVRLDGLLSLVRDLAQTPLAPSRNRPLIAAVLHWIDAVLRQALSARSGASGDVPGLTVAPETVRQLVEPVPLEKPAAPPEGVAAAEAALFEALERADASFEPLAAVSRNLGLDPLEWKFLLLALAPDLDPRYQRCYGFLHDDMGRRVGTTALLASLLGDSAQIRCRLATLERLAQWRLLEQRPGAPLAADEPVHVDRPVAAWILGQWTALGDDQALRRVVRPDPWPGASLIRRPADIQHATQLMDQLRQTGSPAWHVLRGDAPTWAKALLELGATLHKTSLFRVEASRLSATDRVEVREVGVRIARRVRLTGRPVVLDATGSADAPIDRDALHTLVEVLGTMGVRAAVVSADFDPLAGMLAQHGAVSVESPSFDSRARAAMLSAAAHDIGLALSPVESLEIAQRFPLPADHVHSLASIVRSEVRAEDAESTRRERFLGVCRNVASAGISQLAQRIVPTFTLDQVVLAEDRKEQLREIVSNVKLASRVLDDWRFGEQLPYGRGVTALFYGPSGTGKTMAALAVAHALRIEVYKLDLSKVVSKYIGETEKHIDLVFEDARRSGAAILIDEAEALLGKRSEVKDAHDRYANIEVAYLLQRMETFDGLAMLTTNLRQNLDPAFLRRLRFVVDFPRPDAAAREKIWRACLPDGTHTLVDADFRQLARRIDLTGGYIRQITVRAAFAAAAGGRLINLKDIEAATRAELAKLGMPAVELQPAERRLVANG
jgi:AAA+ superfamily predicted ATPase